MTTNPTVVVACERSCWKYFVYYEHSPKIEELYD